MATVLIVVALFVPKPVWYVAPPKVHDADAWIQWYNGERSHTGKYCFRKTPMQTFVDSKHLAEEKELEGLRPDALVAVR